MKPTQFAYHRPTTLREALEILAELGPSGAKLLAGGQSLIPMLNFRLVRPSALIDLADIVELHQFEASESQIHIGSMVKTARLVRDPNLRQLFPLLPHAASWVGHTQIRNRGTIGGSVAHADPSAEMAAILTLTDATLHIASATGTRVASVHEFFLGYLSTSLDEDEILTGVTIETPPIGSRWGFSEFAQRHGDFALAGAACLLDPVQSVGARVVLFGVGSRPFRSTHLESVLSKVGDQISGAEVREAVGADARTEAVVDAGQLRMIESMAVRAIGQALSSNVATIH